MVFCHPVPESFVSALAARSAEALRSAGHEVDLLDLYAEDFQPAMPTEERRRYNEMALADHPYPDHAERLQAAQALVFVYPTWWYGLPAMLKGWLDRVLTPGLAFDLATDNTPIKPLLTHITHCAVITTCGAPMWWSYVVGHPGKRTILRGVRALLARRCKTMFLAHYLMDISTPETRDAYLTKVTRKLPKFIGKPKERQ